MKFGTLNFLDPSGPLQPCNGTALPSTLHYLLNNSLKLKFTTTEGRGTRVLCVQMEKHSYRVHKFSHLTAGYGPFDSPLHRAKRWPKQNWTNITTHTQNTLSRRILRKLACTVTEALSLRNVNSSWGQWLVCTFWLHEAIKLCTCCIESMERRHTDGRDDRDDSFPVTVPSSSPKYVKSQPKVLVVGEGYHVVTSTNIRVSITVRRPEGNIWMEKYRSSWLMGTGAMHRTTFRALNRNKYSASALASKFHPITGYEGPGQIWYDIVVFRLSPCYECRI
jgi:hypothetical protein